MFIKLILLIAFYGFVGWRIMEARAHPGVVTQFLPLWSWIALTLVSLPAALIACVRHDAKAAKLPDNVHSALRELQRRGHLGGFNGLMLLLSRLFYGGMAVWCVVFLYYSFKKFGVPSVYPVVVAIILVNLAYNTLVQLVAWSAFHNKAMNIDDLYAQLPKD